MAASALRDSDDFLLHHFSEAQSVADSADLQLSSEVKSRLPSAVSAHAAAGPPEQSQDNQDRLSSVSPDPKPLEQDEQSRCHWWLMGWYVFATGDQRLACGLEALMQAAWEVPYPNSSVMGLSPRACGACAADSSHSDGSNTNVRDFGVNGADSPPWSPRRVPPAHVWGCGPPRTPGYRSGGACCPIASPGVSAANLVEAACELQALLQRRAAAGLGPLLHAQPFFPVATAAAGTALEPLACPAQGTVFEQEEARLPRAAPPGLKGTVSATPSAQCIGHLPATAAEMGNEGPLGTKRPAAWGCVGDSQQPCGDQDDALAADEVSSPHALSSTPELVVHPHQRWASAPPVQDANSLQLSVKDDSSSAEPHAASAPPEARPTRAGRLGRAPSTPEIMGVSPVTSERILPPLAMGPSQVHSSGVASAAAEQGRARRRTKRRLF
ncbi:hypothetical protein COCOBI_15-0770 [Coccomyxa sp. Obi]|nr:hypothetical protein COCOBI_15-0770 [Coccomyxa sp. Obi]